MPERITIPIETRTIAEPTTTKMKDVKQLHTVRADRLATYDKLDHQLNAIFELDESWDSEKARLFDPVMLIPKFRALIHQSNQAAYKQGWDSAGGELVGIKQDLDEVERTTEIRVWKTVRKSYPKSNASARSVSKLSLADIDRKITELSTPNTMTKEKEL